MVVPFVPPAVHTNGVVVENVTARPDVAVAATVIGGVFTATAPSGPNVIA